MAFDLTRILDPQVLALAELGDKLLTLVRESNLLTPTKVKRKRRTKAEMATANEALPAEVKVKRLKTKKKKAQTDFERAMLDEED